MSELIGQTLTPNLFDLLARGMATVVVATVDDDGWPHTAPYNQVIAMDPSHLRLAINRLDETFRSLSDYGLAMVEVLEEGDIAAGIRGRARIVHEQMEADCNLAVVEIAIDEVKRDNSPRFLVVQGTRTRYRRAPFLLLHRQIMTELRS